MKVPQYFKNNLNRLLTGDELAKVNEARWNAFGPAREEITAKIFYNKGLVLVDDFFSALASLSPRLYFQAGDGTQLSPPKVEPVAGPLFFFWVIGLIEFLKRRQFKILSLPFIFALGAYLLGQSNLAFLLPILVVYAFISFKGLETIKNINWRRFSFFLVFLYGAFLLGRMFLL